MDVLPASRVTATDATPVTIRRRGSAARLLHVIDAELRPDFPQLALNRTNPTRTASRPHSSEAASFSGTRASIASVVRGSWTVA